MRPLNLITYIPLLLIITGLFCASNAFSFRCGTKIVEEGQSKADVRKACGEPDSREYIGVKLIGGTAVRLEEWHYDFGNRQFTRNLLFYGSKLARIETGDYGQGSSIKNSPGNDTPARTLRYEDGRLNKRIPPIESERKDSQEKTPKGYVKTVAYKSLVDINGAGSQMSDTFLLPEGLNTAAFKHLGTGFFSAILKTVDGDFTSEIATGSGALQGSKGITIPSHGSYYLNVKSTSGGEWQLEIEYPDNQQMHKMPSRNGITVTRDKNGVIHLQNY